MIANAAECWTCRCCGGALAHTFNAPSWRAAGWPEYRLGECPTCGTLNLVDAVDPGPFYESYYQHRSRSVSPSVPRRLLGAAAAATAFRTNMFGRLTGRIIRRPYWLRWFAASGVQLSSPILDVGAGGGALLVDLRRHGFDQLRGLDPYIAASTVLDNGAVRIDPIGLNDCPDGGFAVCVLKHVLEHVDDPAAMLTDTARCLDADGLLVVEVPVAQGPVWEKYRDNWVALDPPVHRFVPTVEGMIHLVDSVGLQIVRSWGETTMYHLTQSELITQRSPLDSESRQYNETDIRQLKMDLKTIRRRHDPAQMTFLLKRSSVPA